MKRWGIRSIASLFAVGILVPALGHSAKFSNQFVEFEMPPRWQCNLEGAEWVCQSTDDARKRDAIIVLAAKLKGEQDSLDQYQAYLKAAKTYTSVQGKPVKSEAKYAKTVNINGHAWVDALHLESEIPGFYTRYLATVKTDIGVLVTYSINKDKYQQYLNDFDTMVKTLKVFRKPGGGLNAKPANSNLFQNTQIPTALNEGTVFPVQGGADEPVPVKSKKSGDMMLYMLVAAALVGFFLFKKKRG